MTIMVNKKVTSYFITIVLIDLLNNNPLSHVETSAFKSNASNTFECDLILYIINIVQIEYFHYLSCIHINIVLYIVQII